MTFESVSLSVSCGTYDLLQERDCLSSVFSQPSTAVLKLYGLRTTFTMLKIIESSYIVGGNVEWCSHCRKQFVPQKVKHRITM